MIVRAITSAIRNDLDEKIVILSGPRQCGKTTLSKSLWSKNFQYLSYDSAEDRSLLNKSQWNRDLELIIFDELHKMKKWKSWIKGIYDKEGVRPRLFITGSARMTQFKKTGDSLAGRHFNGLLKQNYLTASYRKILKIFSPISKIHTVFNWYLS